jgi:hypothetical protein
MLYGVTQKRLILGCIKGEENFPSVIIPIFAEIKRMPYATVATLPGEHPFAKSIGLWTQFNM